MNDFREKIAHIVYRRTNENAQELLCDSLEILGELL